MDSEIHFLLQCLLCRPSISGILCVTIREPRRSSETLFFTRPDVWQYELTMSGIHDDFEVGVGGQGPGDGL